MLSPYEERAGELLKEKKKELRVLKKQILTETGFFGKRRLEKKIKETKQIETRRSNTNLTKLKASKTKSN